MNERAKSGQRRGLALVVRPQQRRSAEQGLREGSTGRLVALQTTPGPRPEQVQQGMQPIVPQRVPRIVARMWAVGEAEAGRVEELRGREPEVAFYRKYTEALLRRYLKLSMEAGRVPSILGREMFRGQVTSYRVRGFEDAVIFCHDVERRLERMGPLDQQLLKRIALQRYSRGEAAGALGLSLGHCHRRYGMALDRLTRVLLEDGLLEPQRDCQ